MSWRRLLVHLWIIGVILFCCVSSVDSRRRKKEKSGRRETRAVDELIWVEPIMGAARSTQFETAQSIPARAFADQITIDAFVVKVTDGDTIRVRHVVTANSRDVTGALTQHSIAVRIAAVDTPEIAKLNSPGQPFSQEAKSFVESHLLGKDVRVKLLSLDQYGRVIGRVTYRPTGFFAWFQRDKDISEELLKKGLAAVYRQGGAQYDGPVEHWNALESHAQRMRKGMWSSGVDKAQLPSDFKKAERIRKAETARANQL